MFNLRLSKKQELLVITILILSFIYWTVVPLFKNIFIVLYPISFFHLTVKYRSNILKIYIQLLKIFFPAILLLIIMLYGVMMSSKLYIITLKNFIIALVLFTLIFKLYIVTYSNIDKKVLGKYLIVLSLIFGLIASIYGIYRFYYSLSGLELRNLSFIFGNTENLISDYDSNFALLPVIIGFMTMFLIPKSEINRIKIVLLVMLGILYSLNIILSGSRRGLLIIIIILLLIILLEIIDKRRTRVNYLLSRKYSLTIISSILFFYFITIFLFIKTPCSIKNKVMIQICGSEIFTKKHKVSKLFYRYLYIINNEYNYTNFHDKLWSHGFNPIDPESGWGHRNHELFYNLPDTILNKLPLETRGYLLNNSTNVTNVSGNAMSLTKIKTLELQFPDSINFQVYCFVSPNFNGHFVQIHIKGSNSKTIRKRYDLNQKGNWQLLSIKKYINKPDTLNFFLNFTKKNTTNFDSLSGYVIFVYPLINHSQLHSAEKNSDDRFKPLSSNKVVNQKTKYYLNHNNKPVYKSATLLGLLNNLLLTNKFKALNTNRTSLISFANRDTTYYPYNAQISVSKVKNRHFGYRINRWQFAIQIFQKEYNWRKKLFGGGFDYLNWYGYYFYNNKTVSDWPHNPFLSVLLYSGIVGLLVYIFFLYKVIYYYIKYRKQYGIFFIFFLITFFFAFFSANSPFTPPIMGFLVLLPFLIHYIHKNDNQHVDMNEIGTNSNKND